MKMPENLAPSNDNLESSQPLRFAIDVTAVLLLAISVAVGASFWGAWLSETDSRVCSICIATGFLVAVVSRIGLEPVSDRRYLPWIFLGLAFLVLFYALVFGRPKLTGISAGLAVSGWLARWLRSESVAQFLSLGMAFMVPSFVSACEDRGAFEWIERSVQGLTSGLSETATLFHIQRSGFIEFGHGIADRFSSVERWDSILPFVGISFFCIYVFRRPLIPSLLTLSMAFLVWMAVRASAWVAFAWYAEQHGVWPEWSLRTEIFLFLTGALLIVSLDQFFSSLLAPISSEFINEDLPLIAYLWNWFVLLPAFKFSAPKRAKESFDDEDDLDDEIEDEE